MHFPKLAHEFLCCFHVAMTLDQEIEDFSLAIDSPPEIESLFGDHDHHLVEITQAKRETSLDPNGELDHVRRNTVFMIKRRLHGQKPSRLTEGLAT